AAWWWGFREARTGLGVGVIVGVVLLVSLAFALATGLRGLTPGKALLGLRVVDVDSGRPIGVPRALARGALLGLVSLPTLGLVLSGFAVSAINDPGRRRRGWHDRAARSLVVLAATAPAVEPDEGTPAPQMVNLTAMRL